MKKTKVLFLHDLELEDREFKGNVFAYFPEMPHNSEFMTCYAHIGQHSACHPDYAKECKEATPEQYADLKKELEGIGYKLQVMNKPRVIINHMGKYFDLYEENSFAPFKSFRSHENAEKYCIDKGYEIVACVD